MHSKIACQQQSQSYKELKLIHVSFLLFVVLVKPGIPDDDELHELANYVCPFWKKLGRELKVEELKLSQLELDYQHNAYERAFQTLQHWKEKKLDQATYQILFNALTSAVVGRNDLGKKIFCVNWFKWRVYKDIKLLSWEFKMQ